MSNVNCIFAVEVDCPKDEIKISCPECIENRYYDVIKQAVDDFTSLGESFTDLFLLFNRLMKYSYETTEQLMPLDSMHKINRVMTAFLSQKDIEELKKGEVVYRKLVFYFFRILIDECVSKDYTMTRYVN